MKIPEVNTYMRFYKYAGDYIMVKVQDPFRDPYTRFFKETDEGELVWYNGKTSFNYQVYRYNDWCVCSDAPSHIPNEQEFKWYFDYWKANK